MHIAVVNLTHGGLSGGGRKYLGVLLPLLQQDTRAASVDVFVPEQAGVELSIESTSIHPWPVSDRSRGYPWLKAQLQQLAPDVVLIPGSWWVDYGPFPVVVMVRNMEPLAAPFRGTIPRDTVRNIARAFMTWRACSRATRIVAVSEYVRDFLVQKWRIPESKIGVVYHGVDAAPARSCGVRPIAIQDDTLSNFLFTAGSIRPARGLEDAIKALAILKQRGHHLVLVVGGDPTPGGNIYKQRLERLADRCAVSSQIIWAGHLSPLEMSWCFYHCNRFIMTSRAEACPNIVLEAMAHGCCSISTDQPPMPEFFRDSAYYYKAGNATSLSDQVTKAEGATQAEVERMRSNALSRVSQFNWHTTAERTIAELELALRQ